MLPYLMTHLDKLKEDDQVLMYTKLSSTFSDLVQKFLHGLCMLAGVHTRLKKYKLMAVSERFLPYRLEQKIMGLKGIYSLGKRP